MNCKIQFSEMSKSTMYGCNKTVALSVLNRKNKLLLLLFHNCTDVCRNLANSEMGVTELCTSHLSITHVIIPPLTIKRCTSRGLTMRHIVNLSLKY